MIVAEKEGKSSTDVQKSVSKRFDIDIRAFYLLIADPKDASTKVMIDMERYPLNSVRAWWNADGTPKDQLNKSILTNYKVVEQPTKDMKDMYFDDIPEDSDAEFVSALEETYKEEQPSEISDEFVDANEDDQQQQFATTIRPSQPALTEINKIQTQDRKSSSVPALLRDQVQPNPMDSWNQNLLLMLEVTEIKGSLCKQKNGKMYTKVYPP